MKIFYDEFFSYIIQELKSKRNIAGEIALKEFVELNPELFDFDGIIDNFSSEEDALSYLVKQHLDSFQEWLIKDKHEEISVNLARFRWRMKGGEQTALKPDLVELGIDVDEYKLIDINEVEIDREVVSKLEILYEKIKLRSDKYACYKCARKIARFYERNSTNNKLISDKYLIVAEINRRYETIKSSTYYEPSKRISS